MRPRGSRGLTLIEAVVTSALAALVLSALAGGLFAVQRTVRYGLAEEASAGSTLRIAGLVGDELRDLNLHAQDLEPDPAGLVDFHPTADDPLLFRTVSGFDAADALASLSPARASGGFRRLYLADDGQLILVTPRTGGPVALARDVTDLRLDLDPAAAPAQLRIRVVSTRPHPDDPQRVVSAAAELAVSLSNALEAAE